MKALLRTRFHLKESTAQQFTVARQGFIHRIKIQNDFVQRNEYHQGKELVRNFSQSVWIPFRLSSRDETRSTLQCLQDTSSVYYLD